MRTMGSVLEVWGQGAGQGDRCQGESGRSVREGSAEQTGGFGVWRECGAGRDQVKVAEGERNIDQRVGSPDAGDDAVCGERL